jgi:hypothetical protein
LYHLEINRHFSDILRYKYLLPFFLDSSFLHYLNLSGCEVPPPNRGPRTGFFSLPRFYPAPYHIAFHKTDSVEWSKMDYFTSSLPYPDFPLTSIYVALGSKTPTVIMSELLADSNLAVKSREALTLSAKKSQLF